MSEEELQEECLSFLRGESDAVVFHSNASTVIARLNWGPHSCRGETPVTIKRGQPKIRRRLGAMRHSPDATLLSIVISQCRSEQVQATRFPVIPHFRVVVQAELAHGIITVFGIRRVAG